MWSDTRRQRNSIGYGDGETTVVGHVSGEPDEQDADEPIAQLWLPNPDTRRGWEMRHVYPQRAKQAGKSLGFGRGVSR